MPKKFQDSLRFGNLFLTKKQKNNIAWIDEFKLFLPHKVISKNKLD